MAGKRFQESDIVSWLIAIVFSCVYGLEPINTACPGGFNCWCGWDTAHTYRPSLDDKDHIICDTGDTGEDR